MNPRYIVLSVSIVIMLFSAQNCFAQTTMVGKKPPQIFMQIQLRDAEGHFVGYIEGYPQIFYLDRVIDWVEPLARKSTVLKDGERHEIMHYVGSLDQFESQIMGAYFLKLPINGKMTTVLYFHHDSFSVLSSDTAQVFWTIFR